MKIEEDRWGGKKWKEKRKDEEEKNEREDSLHHFRYNSIHTIDRYIIVLEDLIVQEKINGVIRSYLNNEKNSTGENHSNVERSYPRKTLD